MKILDLFSGAGGLTEGFRSDNFEIICHVEMDKDACLSLKTREAFYYLKESNNLSIYTDYLNKLISRDELYETVPNEIIDKVQNFEINQNNLLDIFSIIDTKLDNNHLAGIIGGPPCQAYSTIGRARNKKIKETDSRIYLYEYYIEFLKKYSPDFFVFENVKGLLSFKDQKGELLFPKIISAFSSVGYELEYKILNSEKFGVSQKRERLFLVGTKNTINLNSSFFEVIDTMEETPPIIFELLKDLPNLKSGSSCDTYSTNSLNDYVRKYIRKYEYMPLTYQIARPHNKNDLEIYKIVAKAKKEGKNVHYYDLPKRLQTHKNTKAFVDRFKAIDGTSYSHTVVAHIAKDGHYYIHPDVKQNRSITVREAARIQSFPDDYYFESSRTAAFKQIGNAVPPILSRKIAETLIEIL
ncbi:DNA (cytosine-5)-methyltransferase 1 [Enterococcus sp. DIV2402]|uniref:DNA (cytosine-5-)-methyltransferase n=1 Tax=Candidatus Enterococcus lowellii TaxID=2230877 RepID=A0ABZ2SIQ3_9ENTE|nr:DNA cytosine methyltransferase [Enterococcus sp. DIV2402]MBO0464799.1 DNA cytosine methyltransferase [Enterococcus sp. DIV2402]